MDSTARPARVRDEHYILDLCDSVLGRQSLRQHRFQFLVGDGGHRLPVDAFYPDLNLVVEYKERQHSEPHKFFDRRQTISGVPRGEQRRLYDQRRRAMLQKHGLTLIELDCTDFRLRSGKRLARSEIADINVIEAKLAPYLKSRDVGFDCLVDKSAALQVRAEQAVGLYNITAESGKLLDTPLPEPGERVIVRDDPLPRVRQWLEGILANIGTIRADSEKYGDSVRASAERCSVPATRLMIHMREMTESSTHSAAYVAQAIEIAAELADEWHMLKVNASLEQPVRREERRARALPDARAASALSRRKITAEGLARTAGVKPQKTRADMLGVSVTALKKALAKVK